MNQEGRHPGEMVSAALRELQEAVAEAHNANLREAPARLKEEVTHTLAFAEKMTPDRTPEEIDTAKLALRVALDRLRIDPDAATIGELQEMVRTGKLTYERLVRMYLARIDLYSARTVRLNAIACLNPNAIRLAMERDAAVQADPSLAAGLFGIPVLIKDNIGTAAADGMPTTAGSIALANHFPAEDAFVVRQLKKSGAVILGKTNLSEFANFITFGMRNGYSSLHGQVLNPYGPDVLDVSGSSSGSGAAAAAALAAVTVGTETSGSILSPAALNSLVGLKPTVGLVSRNGVIPLAHSQDTAGPMGRNVSDVAALLTAMQGYDPDESYLPMGADNEIEITESYLGERLKNYAEDLRVDGLQGKVLGVYRTPDKEETPDVHEVFLCAVQALRDQGAKIVYAGNGGDLADELPKQPDTKVLFYDFKEDIEQYLLAQAQPALAEDGETEIRSLADIVNYNRRYPERIPYGQSILEECLQYDMTPGSKDAQTSLEHRAEDLKYSRKNGLNALFSKYGLDGLIAMNGAATAIAAMAGYPSITVPAGYCTAEGSQGQPINLQITGDAFTEDSLIRMGYAFEQATKARIAPEMTVR
ncbi:amidase family protein [Paenibacillus macerans]|uniref:amidase family protein n=1 Tax=Paenibacillus macerans TaxID=44252 RepID=UPI003D32064D